jgi:hypothetical protein
MTGPSPRAWWLKYEVVHAVVYFDPECLAAMDGLGLHSCLLQLPSRPGTTFPAGCLVAVPADRRVDYQDARCCTGPASGGPRYERRRP